MATRVEGSVAFALGGLGGLNAHGVGFLEAARALEVEPDFVTCSSGMIPWVADWLEGQALLPRLEEMVRQGVRFPPPFHWMNTLWIAAFGDPATFRPAIWEYWRRWMKPLDGTDARAFMERLWPAQVFVPRRSDDEFRRLAGILNAASVPVAFNSFHVPSGRGCLHLNPAAQERLGVRLGEVGGPDKYLPINERTVRGALWLYFYGFDEDDNPDGLVDGSYDRQYVIRELHHCRRIYVTRPHNTRWDSRRPRNYFEIQDFTTDQGFNRAYAAELTGLEQINRLLGQGALSPERFHPVEVVEIAVERPFGFFESFVDDREVFDLAFRRAYQVLTARECAIESRK
jgi:hypothetical protein